jgi:hypothetical protein
MVPCPWRRWVTLASAALGFLSFAVPLAAAPPSFGLAGAVKAANGAPIAGALCTLTGPGLAEGLSVRTGTAGTFAFTGLIPGSYNLTCAYIHHLPVEKKGIGVGGRASPYLEVVLPPEVLLRQKVEVHARAGGISAQSAAQPSTLNSVALESLPLVQEKFTAALPLIPGVVRTPDGRISIKGSLENQGMLLVDSAETVDPVTGSFSIDVPIDAIESLQVYKTAYLAQYGRFSGGLTTIHTKAPPAQWTYQLNDFLPTPRIEAGHIAGVADDRPRLSFGGPILPGKLNFAEYLVYIYGRNPVRGLPYPHNEIKTEGLTSLTDFQYILSDRHLLSASVSVFPLRHEFADINSLVPQSASSNYGQRGESVGLTDRFLRSSGGILTTAVKETLFSSYAHGQGSQDMLVTPEGWGGNFFNAWTRSSNQQEVFQTYAFPQWTVWGRHSFTIGSDFIHRAYNGLSSSRPVLVERQDGSVAETIDFSGPASLNAEDTEGAAFAEDHWALNDRLAVEMGLRYSGQTIGEVAAVSPRVGLVYTPGSRGRTVLRGGFGVFYDRVPLLAGDFTGNPVRTVTTFGASGLPLGPPIAFRNFYEKVDEEKGVIVPSGHHLASTPYNLTWNAELDQELTPNLLARLSYLSSRTYDEFVVDPRLTGPTSGLLLLSNTGRSRYHELESTLRYRPGSNADLNVSYIYSRARGDLNTLSEIYVPFEQPVIRADFFGNLPSDIPQRVVAWGRFRLPWRMTVSPLFDLHSGFPYSAFDVLQNYAGAPDRLRFPAFLSLDMKLVKDFHFPLVPWLKSHTLRGGLQIFNVTNHQNPRDVFSSIVSPFYGHFVGFQHRTYDVSVDVIY